jgi:hypothetical protein
MSQCAEMTLHYDLKIVVDAQNAKRFWIKRSVNSECQQFHQNQQNEQLPLTLYHWLCWDMFFQVSLFFILNI